jgi:hypothetical protein
MNVAIYRGLVPHDHVGHSLTWSAVLLALLVCHVGGDFLLQTEWQATTKVRGLGDPDGRRALALHVSTYTAAYLPALVWIGYERNVLRAAIVAGLVALPHLLIDDGRFVRGWLLRVKHVDAPQPALRLMVDQSMHLVCLLGVALLAAA